jgi:hypothetical protein
MCWREAEAASRRLNGSFRSRNLSFSFGTLPVRVIGPLAPLVPRFKTNAFDAREETSYLQTAVPR